MPNCYLKLAVYKPCIYILTIIQVRDFSVIKAKAVASGLKGESARMIIILQKILLKRKRAFIFWISLNLDHHANAREVYLLDYLRNQNVF
uniref:4'-phosphopantetheinyl transferase n=1 Tax=Nostoc flagelliforme str. Sunitezuoqi TaxID=676037 RepID=E7DPM5_9NOSO|nr:4'-phosphopantetheinyl transferase [Nostoc flagelliforme str. Sunitezuoqi]